MIRRLNWDLEDGYQSRGAGEMADRGIVDVVGGPE